MTELQLGMIGLSATVVVGVYAYNKWQEYRHRKVAEAMLQPGQDDVLLNGGARPARRERQPERAPEKPVERMEPACSAPVAQEPSLHELPVIDDPEPVIAPEDMSDNSPVQVFAPVAESDLPPVFAEPEDEPVPAAPVVQNLAAPAPAERAPVEIPHVALPPELLDPRIELIVAMELVEPVSSRQILLSQRDVLRRLGKPVHWVGFDESRRKWLPLHSDEDIAVRRLRIGLPLVNRLGPVAEGDLALFNGAMQALADELMAVADLPSSRPLDQAAEIDRFCAAVDLEIGLNLVSRGIPFPGTKIRALAEAAGMTLGVDGLFTRYDDAGRPQFSLQNYENTLFSGDSLRTLTTHGITFLLDVPRVEHGEAVFVQMVALAQRFAEVLQGMLVDDNRNPLGESQLDHIRREFIGKPQATMRSFGLAAGSPQALRLFS
ncbi:cell division protein ZipA C-terminal FtsZ-binding domain-containing protein [Azonexus sp.]|uniref:cell division protein ZipA C-terminal FtsZ-binding domain-containing protein n=1 Tax=Azonexus sp. TaxID=1872668 RepID=UPI0035B491E1